MTLRTYRQKRRFQRTPEPRGRTKKSRGFSYVVHKHDASHLHYDFRLELDGVLLSWAVPKGPSLDPSEKRLAMQTEDHPVDYGGFEGIIPEGEYGAGTVMIWDRGTWEPNDDARAEYERGRLTFTLHGEKLHGKWHLVRTASDAAGRRRWLLFKGADDQARPGARPIVDAEPLSAVTGRSLDEIAGDAESTWHSDTRAKRRSSPRAVSRARDPAPELATLVKAPPEGDDWFHEVKFDGYRIVASIARGKVTLLSRNQKDWTARLPTVARALARVDATSALLDGEVVALREDGVSDFQTLQNSLGDEEADLTYFVFDLLERDGRDLRTEPLERRKAQLETLLPSTRGIVRLADHVVGHGPDVLAHACKLGLEGIVSKRRDAPYREGRGRDWLKIKCASRQEFVIVGWTDPKGARVARYPKGQAPGFGALLLGVREGRRLVYVGKVGTGFSMASVASLAPKLEALARDNSPLANPPRERGIHWVEPKLVCEVAYGSMTRDGILRHSSFQGLRQDKPASEIVLERSADKTLSPKARARTKVSNEDKIYYPETGITKGEIAAYYERVADWMLPHVARRPLMLLRCPDGIEPSSRCFVQKSAGLPIEGTRPIDVGEGSPQMVIDDRSGLLGFAQAGVLEVHTWGSHEGSLERPDLLVFDLDPDPAVTWAELVAGARLLRERLRSVKLESFVKTTGGKGLHVCCAIEPSLDWDTAKDFTRKLAEAMVREDPTRFVARMTKARRAGKIFIDYFRNGRGATFVAPYSPRARPGAPVAMPLAWDELTPKLRPERFTVRTATKRLDALKSDPWHRLRSPAVTSRSRSKG